MPPRYTFEKIKFATDPTTFEKAVKLYEDKKVVDFKDDFGDYSAVVKGTQPYRVSVSGRQYDEGSCECYLGQNNYHCKHMVAVAIYACLGGEKISVEDKTLNIEPKCSGKLGELSAAELAVVKSNITAAIKYIKPYNGPSRIWFAYQASLSEGCARLAAIVSKLPVSLQTAKLLIDLLLRLDKKLCTGVDDSDGTVGGFIQEVVAVLVDYYALDKTCIKAFEKLCQRDTCFEWEEPLVRIVDEPQG